MYYRARFWCNLWSFIYRLYISLKNLYLYYTYIVYARARARASAKKIYFSPSLAPMTSYKIWPVRINHIRCISGGKSFYHITRALKFLTACTGHILYRTSSVQGIKARYSTPTVSFNFVSGETWVDSYIAARYGLPWGDSGVTRPWGTCAARA